MPEIGLQSSVFYLSEQFNSLFLRQPVIAYAGGISLDADACLREHSAGCEFRQKFHTVDANQKF